MSHSTLVASLDGSPLPIPLVSRAGVYRVGHDDLFPVCFGSLPELAEDSLVLANIPCGKVTHVKPA